MLDRQSVEHPNHADVASGREGVNRIGVSERAQGVEVVLQRADRAKLGGRATRVIHCPILWSERLFGTRVADVGAAALVVEDFIVVIQAGLIRQRGDIRFFRVATLRCPLRWQRGDRGLLQHAESDLCLLPRWRNEVLRDCPFNLVLSHACAHSFDLFIVLTGQWRSGGCFTLSPVHSPQSQS